MELQRERAASDLKCLVKAAVTLGQMHGAGWKIERLAVPVEHLRPVRKRKRVPAGAAGVDRKPADLLLLSRIDARAERTGHELRAETDAEHRPIRVDRLSHQPLLVAQ